MAKLATKPEIAAFLELETSHAGPDLRFEELDVTASCAAAGQTIRDLRIRRDTGALVIAVRKGDGSIDITPNPNARLEVGDVAIAMGTQPELVALEELLAPQATLAS